MNKKYIFVTGGVVSGLGKGIVASSIGCLLEQEGIKVKMQKNDPYLNVNAGTMNPTEHGETFVLNDGSETDLDLGHYERFLNKRLDKNSTFTSGKVYKSVLENEEKGIYLGKTVQLIPHVSNQIIKNFTIFDNDNDCDVVIVEIGGTVGDYESQIYLEAVRQLKESLKENMMLIHVVLLPFISGSNELKSKPAQHSVMALQQFGLTPDMLICRTDKPLEESMKQKLSLFCHLPEDKVIENITVKDIYLVPEMLNKQGVIDIISERFKLYDLNNVQHTTTYNDFVEKLNLYYDISNSKHTLKIGILGKYLKLDDSYLSIYESLRLAAIKYNVDINIVKINTEVITKDSAPIILKGFDGIIVPGGFGERLTQNIIDGLEYIRKENIPCLGICYGLQLMAIEYARNVLNIDNAISEEWLSEGNDFLDNVIPVVKYMKDQKYLTKLSGTMRLGNYEMSIKSNSLLFICYKNTKASMKHRHRLEINESIFKDTDFVISGYNEELQVPEALELKTNDFYIGVQGHPELDTTIFNVNPLFDHLILVAYQNYVERYKELFKDKNILSQNTIIALNN